ncbi:MAG TPA: glycogen debranching N-terminal domain-containing protein [Candidatus Limnocylindrales bacterium]
MIKDGEPFFVCPPDGQIPLDGAHGFGLYHHDTRFLEGYELRILDVAPDCLAATAAAGTSAILELTNPEIHLENGRTIGKDRLAIRWTRALEGDRAELLDTIAVRNSDVDDVTLTMRVEVAASFRDVFEVRGLLKAPRGSVHKPAWNDAGLVFASAGRDRVRRTLTATFDPAPSEREEAGATVELAVPGRGSATLEIRLRIGEQVEPGAAPIERRSPSSTARSRPSPLAVGRPHGGWVGGDGWATAVRTNAFLFDAVVGRSRDDLVLLRGELDGRRYYVAGLPWFSTLFRRRPAGRPRGSAA